MKLVAFSNALAADRGGLSCDDGFHGGTLVRRSRSICILYQPPRNRNPCDMSAQKPEKAKSKPITVAKVRICIKGGCVMKQRRNPAVQYTCLLCGSWFRWC